MLGEVVEDRVGEGDRVALGEPCWRPVPAPAVGPRRDGAGNRLAALRLPDHCPLQRGRATLGTGEIGAQGERRKVRPPATSRRRRLIGCAIRRWLSDMAQTVGRDGTAKTASFVPGSVPCPSFPVLRDPEAWRRKGKHDGRARWPSVRLPAGRADRRCDGHADREPRADEIERRYGWVRELNGPGTDDPLMKDLLSMALVETDGYATADDWAAQIAAQQPLIRERRDKFFASVLHLVGKLRYGYPPRELSEGTCPAPARRWRCASASSTPATQELRPPRPRSWPA